ncbi:DUF5776 domain-containing protein [Secundilactobacillus hailunensis]|uniref:DUF5776 domain-containing protein n=1 Tax=Secundilactobacillus hailunensis TaxID=2559923 RepID=A0ABW1T8N1_9LACO|nr:DUF5776 domain-containing protein [Secundilactobacillus hailunensis]
MLKKRHSGLTAKTVQLPWHVLMTSALFSSSLLLGSLMLNVKAHAEDRTTAVSSTNIEQSVADTPTAESVATAAPVAESGSVPATNSAPANNASVENETASTVPTASSATTTTESAVTPQQGDAEGVATETPANQPVGETVSTNETNVTSATNESTQPASISKTSSQPVTQIPEQREQSTAASTSLKDRSGVLSETDPQVATQALPEVQTVAPAKIGVDLIKDVKLNVPVPTNGTNAITATNAFNVTNAAVTNMKQLNVHPKMTTIGQQGWQGSTYAAAIPATATGVDPATNKLYIDEWMPDTGMQYLTYMTNYQTNYATFDAFRSQFSKANLATMTDFTTANSLQESGPTTHAYTQFYAYMMQGWWTMEGMQYATSLQNIDVHDYSAVTQATFGQDVIGNLWDISALAGLPNLKAVKILDQPIQDMSVLRSLPQLTSIDIGWGQVSDPSGLNVNYPQSILRYQYIPISPMVFPVGTTSVQITFNVVGTDGLPRTVNPYGGISYPGDNGYSVIASTANAARVGTNTIVFSNLLTPPNGRYGVLTAFFPMAQPNGVTQDAFDGYITIPYLISNTRGRVNVNYQYLQTDGQQPEIGASATLTNTIGTAFDLNNNSATNFPMSYLVDKLGSKYIVLNGTGKYSDYLAGNGQANRVVTTGTFAAADTNLTVLFADTIPATVQHGYYQGGNFISFGQDDEVDTDINGGPLISSTVKSIPHYTFSGAAVVDPNGVVIPISATTVPYLIPGYTLRLTYAPVTVSVPITIKDNLGTVLATGSGISGAYTATFPLTDLQAQLPNISNYTYDHVTKLDGSALGANFTFGDVEDGLVVIFNANTLIIPVQQVDEDGNPLTETTISGPANGALTPADLAMLAPTLPHYVIDHLVAADGSALLDNFTYADIVGGIRAVYAVKQVNVAVRVMDELGNLISTDLSISGPATDELNATVLAKLIANIPGYTFKTLQDAQRDVIQLPTLYGSLPSILLLVYTKDALPENPSTPGSPITTPPAEIQPWLVGHVIYALTTLKLYSSPEFATSNVLATYVKKPRIYRPRFMVIGWVYDSQNQLRYQVRDINEKSATYGLTGYVDADPAMVRSAYYQTLPSAITVLNPKGINSYSTADLTGKVDHYKQGTVLQIVSLVADRVATRFILADGSYITANKQLVKMGVVPMPSSANKLAALNRYDDLQLTKRNQHYPAIAPQTFRIKGWDYSNGYNYQVKSLKRYLVSGGYITAYSVLVKAQF